MTSSFTNMALGARFLGFSKDSAAYAAQVDALARSASCLLQSQMSGLAKLARKPFRCALFLGSRARFAAAREASLKMLEMTAGRVTTMCETWLGLRHGPMSGVHGDTLVVCFLSSDPGVRAYEVDVLREMESKAARASANHCRPRRPRGPRLRRGFSGSLPLSGSRGRGSTCAGCDGGPVTGIVPLLAGRTAA